MPHGAIEIKWASWPIWLIASVLLFAVGLNIYNGLNKAYWNAQYISVGKAVDCRNRPPPTYLQWCNPKVDGVHCIHESRTRLAEWHEPIDFACAQFEPDRTFVFPVDNEPESLEVAGVG